MQALLASDVHAGGIKYTAGKRCLMTAIISIAIPCMNPGV